MSNPMPVGLGPDEDERVAVFRFRRFVHEEGMAAWMALPARERKAGRRSVREVVDALRACGYRVERVADGENGLRCTDEAFGFEPQPRASAEAGEWEVRHELLRDHADGRATRPMTPAERTWCLAELRRLDRFCEPQPGADATDAELAKGVLRHWTLYARDKT